jgi:predicted CXXCH cytochrome family protein
MDPEKYRHDISTYERPTGPFRCGRAASWGKPCWQGPDLGGHCQGASECSPILKGQRYECRRPTRAGGPCQAGPLPDGMCPHGQPPCQPRATLRSLRKRFSIIALVIVIASIALGTTVIRPASSGASTAAIDPGPLSRAHSEFTRKTGCVSCHAAHDTEKGNWFAWLVNDSDVSSSCTNCHAFSGPATNAHNMAQVPDGVPQVGCGTCHTEHQGADVNISTVANVTCSNCHQKQVTNFEHNHPAFDARYPSALPDRVRFDHARHLTDYFVTPKWLKGEGRDADFAAQARDRCTACHKVDGATRRRVQPAAFEKICAGCHAGQIRERTMPLMAQEEPTVLMGYVLGLDVDTAEEEQVLEQRQELLEQVQETGAQAFAERLQSWNPQAPVATLFEALDPQLSAATASAWLEDSEFEPAITTEQVLGGWRAGTDDEGVNGLRYHPSRHADPIVRAWINTAFQSSRNAKDETHKAAGQLALEVLLDPDSGPGACGKCHRAAIMEAAADESPNGPAWGFRTISARPHTAYSHRPHVTLLGPDVSCPACHVLDEKVEYAAYFSVDNVAKGKAASRAFESNFTPIAKPVCEQCHNDGGVHVDCQLCHTYHRNPSFNSIISER